MDQPGRPRVAQPGAGKDPGALDRSQAAPLGRRGSPKGLCGGHFFELAQAPRNQEAEIAAPEPGLSAGLLVCRRADATGVPPADVNVWDGWPMPACPGHQLSLSVLVLFSLFSSPHSS